MKRQPRPLLIYKTLHLLNQLFTSPGIREAYKGVQAKRGPMDKPPAYLIRGEGKMKNRILVFAGIAALVIGGTVFALGHARSGMQHGQGRGADHTNAISVGPAWWSIWPGS